MDAGDLSGVRLTVYREHDVLLFAALPAGFGMCLWCQASLEDGSRPRSLSQTQLRRS